MPNRTPSLSFPMQRYCERLQMLRDMGLPDVMLRDRMREIALEIWPDSSRPMLYPVDFPVADIGILSCGRQAKLLFNGTALLWLEDGNSRQWPAYSGTEDYWQDKKFSPADQAEKNSGPIPEGTYLVPQSRWQQRPEDWRTTMLGWLGFGTWPGGDASWGDFRIWLEPQDGTTTYGRSGFSIHGGTGPGSKGCIDLVEHMPAFSKMFREYGESILLEVNYSGIR